MTVALGASAYSAAIFHLMTHAFFKALLFLGAGSVIIALHHEQDMRKMGGLWKFMPWTYATVLIGAIASVGVPGLAGFFSKDAIIEAVGLSGTPGAGFAWLAVTLCVFVTAFYTFRLVFYAFHGEPRLKSHGHGEAGHGEHAHPPHESPPVVTVPLVLLAIPSVCAGWLIGPVLFGDYFGSSIVIAPSHSALSQMAREFHGVVPMMQHALKTAPFWLTVAGIAAAWYLYILRPELPGKLRQKAGVLVTLLEEKYFFDRFNDWFFAGGARKFGSGLWRFGDVTVIDGIMVNGSAKLIGWFAGVVRWIQSGFIYHYAFSMIIGVALLLTYFIFLRGTLVY
jgi:NADH-quinone oxidoreductase subunit L